MSMLDYKTYEEAREKFTIDQIWELFDGTPEHFNLGHECLDRHRDKGTAVRIQFDDGHREEYSFSELSRWTSQFAHLLESFGVAKGDRVAVMHRGRLGPARPAAELTEHAVLMEAIGQA